MERLSHLPKLTQLESRRGKFDAGRLGPMLLTTKLC